MPAPGCSARCPQDISIVNSSILTALRGGYGDLHATERTRGSTMWINPLMPIYWGFELEVVARRVRYLDALRATATWDEVRAVIGRHRESVASLRRIRGQIPD